MWEKSDARKSGSSAAVRLKLIANRQRLEAMYAPIHGRGGNRQFPDRPKSYLLARVNLYSCHPSVLPPNPVDDVHRRIKFHRVRGGRLQIRINVKIHKQSQSAGTNGEIVVRIPKKYSVFFRNVVVLQVLGFHKSSVVFVTWCCELFLTDA